jgi:hypothetical protein
VAEQLSPYIGAFNARVAVKTFAQRAEAGSRGRDLEHLPALLEALRPMLNTLVGRTSTEALLEQIRDGVS